MANWWRKAVGEMSALRDRVFGGLGWSFTTGTYGAVYKVDSSKVDVEKTRALYNNTEDSYKLGAGFAKKIVNATVGFMGVPHVTHADETAQIWLNGFFQSNTSKMTQTNRDTIRDGDCYVWVTREEDKSPLYPEVRTRLVYNMIPPEMVQKINRDPVTGEPIEYILVSEHSWQDDAGTNRRARIKQRLRNDIRIVEIDGDTPPGIDSGEHTNPWGFIPIVHFTNERDASEEFGKSDLEPVEPFLKAYHDVLKHAITGSKMHSTPRLKLKLKNVSQFLQNNFGVSDPAEFARKGGTINLDGHELLIFQTDEDADFVEAKSTTGDAKGLLQLLFYCIVASSETPEFVFGVHMPSSLSSVKEQMPVFVQKVERKRGQLAESWKMLARMVLAMMSKAENISIATFDTTLVWEDIDPRDSKEVSDELKTTVDALANAVNNNIMSLPAAVQYLARFVDTIHEYEPEDDDIEGERDRIIATRLFLDRLADGEGLDAEREALKRVV